MQNQITTFEIATRDNLFPRGYVMANRDLPTMFGADELAATVHLRHFGLKESRKQLTREFVEWTTNTEQKRARFERFKQCFGSLPDDVQHFPIYFGKTFENLRDYDAESANCSSGEFLHQLNSHPDGLYADIGAGLRDVVCQNCLYVEVYPSLTTDVIIEPSSELPFKTASLDGIGCFAVLEHVREPWKLAAEFARVVKPGGKIFIDWPFLQPVHGYPSHYYNATREGLRGMFERHFLVEVLQTGTHQGPDFTVQWILSWLLHAVTDRRIREQLESKTVGQMAAEMPQSPFWIEIMKSMDAKSIETLSCGNMLIGSRNQEAAPIDGADNDASRRVISQTLPPIAWWQRVLRRNKR